MSRIENRSFGELDSGLVTAYILTNPDGIRVTLLNYGGIVQSIQVPSRSQGTADVVLGFETLPEYLEESPYFGCITGRYANRIANGRFVLDGEEYQLARNNEPNSLHGGTKGFDKQLWAAEAGEVNGEPALELRHISVDGDEGYPGTLTVSVTYRLTSDNTLAIDYFATTDRPTVINLTNHSYFNLAGEGSVSIEQHLLQLRAESYTPIDANLIPTGEVITVADTPFDFRTAKSIGRDLRSNHPQILIAKGIDHNFVLNNEGLSPEVGSVAEVIDPASGRRLEVSTDQPGIQVYTGNFLDGSVVGKSGRSYRQSDAIALETQHFPDSPNRSNFPTTTLQPGEEYRTATLYRFSW